MTNPLSGPEYSTRCEKLDGAEEILTTFLPRCEKQTFLNQNYAPGCVQRNPDIGSRAMNAAEIDKTGP
jgi:hypothetical protein